MLETVMATVEQFTDKNVGDVDPDGRDTEVGATVGSVPPPNDSSSPEADDLEKPRKTASRCMLVMTGSATVWLRVRTKYD